MTDKERNNILQKIRKLLNLKESAEKVGNEGEAYAAAKGVHRLILKYNLSMEDVKDAGQEKGGIDIGETESISYNDKYGCWKRGLLQVICQFNFCQGLIQSGNKSFSIVGEKQNIIIVKKLYEYLVAAFRHLASLEFKKWLKRAVKDVTEYAAARGKWVPFNYLEDTIKKKESKTFYRSYYKGVVDGLYEQYRQMQPSSEETALMVTHNKAIDEYLKTLDTFTGKTFHERRNRNPLDADAYYKGVRAGENINLSPQLEQTKLHNIEAV